MLNLLPPIRKEELIQEEKLKIIFILGILVLFALVSFSLMLFSTKFFVAGEAEMQKIIFEQKEKEFKNSQIQILAEKIVIVNEKLSQVDSFYQNQPKIREILEKIATTLPAETYLTNLSMNAQGKVLGFNLTGFAPTRETLQKFKANLEKEKTFSETNFPSFNWLDPININFSVSFKVK